MYTSKRAEFYFIEASIFTPFFKIQKFGSNWSKIYSSVVINIIKIFCFELENVNMFTIIAYQNFIVIVIPIQLKYVFRKKNSFLIFVVKYSNICWFVSIEYIDAVQVTSHSIFELSSLLKHSLVHSTSN